MTDRIRKFVYPLVFGHSKELLQNRFFDLSTPSRRKGRDGGKGGGKKIIAFLVATNIVAS